MQYSKQRILEIVNTHRGGGDISEHGTHFSGVTLPSLLPENLSLPYTRNIIRFSFAASACLGDYPDIRYRYILDGYDKKWSGISSESYSLYRNLPSGEFTFRVRARGRNMHEYGIRKDKLLQSRKERC